MSYVEYLIQHEHGGSAPQCECGCGELAPFTVSQGQGFKRFIHGHHARIRERSAEERLKIGEKNSENMKKFYAEHPEAAIISNQKMRAGVTKDSEFRRLQKSATTRRSLEQRIAAGKRSRKLWTDDRKKMENAREKGQETFKGKIADGTYRDAGGLGSEEWRQKISKSVVEKYRNGGFEWSRGKHRSPKLIGKEMAYYRSSWELRHMQEMDADENVRCYEYEPFYMLYELDGVEHRYLPDFVVTFMDGRKELQEVGVTIIKETISRNIEKRRAAERYCSLRPGWSYRAISFVP